MTEQLNPYRLYTASLPLPSCRFRKDDLVRLYNYINERQLEQGREWLGFMVQQPNESDEEFQRRRDRVERAFHTTVNITGVDNEVVSGSGADFITSTNVPDNIRVVYFTNTAGPAAIGINEGSIGSRITLLLDFSRSVELGTNPAFGTSNTSSLNISSGSEAWFTSLHSKLTKLINDRRTKFDWLHRPGFYDVLLILLGIPFAFWLSHKAGTYIEKYEVATILKTSLYVYAFFIGIYAFRLLFGYSRWVFPKIELAEAQTASVGHRALWVAVMIGAFGNATYDILKSFLQ